MIAIKNIFKTAVMVTVLSAIERFLGFVYRIYLSRTIGAEGLGLYQIALSVLGLFMTITSSGIPITVSRMLTKNKANNLMKDDSSTITSGIIIAIFLSLPITLIVLFNEQWLSFLFTDKRCVEILRIMIPGLAFTAIYAVIRGVFWGRTQFFSYSIIELSEEAVMLIAGIILVSGVTSPMQGAERAGYAVLISYLFSFSVSLIVYLSRGGKFALPKKTLKPLISSSAPITAMRTSTSLINTLVSIVLPARLVSFGMESALATAEFGKIFGMALPMIFMPSTLIGSLALVLVPELSDNYYSGKRKTLKNNVNKALNFSCFIACMIVPVFLTLGTEISTFLYSDESVGEYIIKAAIVMLPLSISIISTSMLNSLNKEKQTLLHFIIGAVALILSIWFLPKYLGVNALIVGMGANYAISSLLNVLKLRKTIGEKLAFPAYLLKSTIFIIPTSIFGFLLKNLFEKFSNDIVTIVAVGIVIAIFELALFGVFDMIDLKKSQRKNFFNGLTSDSTGRTRKSNA